MKKLLSVLLCLTVFCAAFSQTAYCAFYDPENQSNESYQKKVDADIYYLFSADDGSVICEKNIDKKAAPASITKVVTALVTIQNCEDLEKVITVPSYTIRLLDGTNSSTAGILVGEQMSVRELLYCLLVYSANDAANVLADYIGGGSIEAFVAKMNEFAASVGCTATHFSNAHGLDADDHYTTARDLGKIYKVCLENSIFTEIAGTARYEIPPTNMYKETRYLNNTNKMFSSGISDYYCKYVKTGKTGTTDNAGHCVITSASGDGYNYICVVLNAPMYDCDNDGVEENMAFVTAKALYEWTFKYMRLCEVANPSTYVGEMPVALSSKYDYVSLVPAKSVSALIPSNLQSSDGSDKTGSVLIEPVGNLAESSVNAPVKKGDVLGKATIKYADNVIAEIDLVAAFDVERSPVKYAGYLLKSLVSSSVFKIVFLLCIVVLLPLCIYVFVVLPKKKRKKKNTVRIVKMNDDDKRNK